MTWQLAALVLGVVGTLVPIGRLPPRGRWRRASRSWRCVAGVVDGSDVGDAVDALAAPLGFLLVAVPLAVVLDGVGFFATVAALVDGGRHLRLGLWVLAAAVVSSSTSTRPSCC